MGHTFLRMKLLGPRKQAEKETSLLRPECTQTSGARQGLERSFRVLLVADSTELRHDHSRAIHGVVLDRLQSLIRLIEFEHCHLWMQADLRGQ